MVRSIYWHHSVCSQEKIKGGFRYLEQFVYDDLDEKAPVWTFHVSEVTVRKSACWWCMAKIQLLCGMSWTIRLGRRCLWTEPPLFPVSTSKKKSLMPYWQLEEYKLALCGWGSSGRTGQAQYCIGGGIGMLYLCDECGTVTRAGAFVWRDVFRRMRARDGRVAFGNALWTATLNCTSKNIYLLLSAEKPDCAQECYHELYGGQNSARKKPTAHTGKSVLVTWTAACAECRCVCRAAGFATDGKSIIAGHPFLGGLGTW